MTADLDRAQLRQRLQSYSRFVKIEHTLFSLPILFAGAILAAGTWPSWRTTWLILLAGTGARTLALALNRIIDRSLDKKNPRTATRELATGALSVWDAILIAAAGFLLYIWSAQQISDFCLMWSWLPVLLFFIYPMLKRFTWFSHMGLGITWAMAPLGGWFAVRPGFQGCWPAVILAVFSFFWLAGFDIIYATLDEEFDKREGLFSLPAFLGKKGALRVSSIFHWAAFACLVALYLTALNGVGAAFLMILAGFLLFFEHMFVDNVDLAFFKVNIITGFVILGMVLFGVGAEF